MEHQKDDWAIKYFEEKFKNIREKFEERDTSLALQAKEYERRLEGLNHENARVLAAQEKSVSIEKFEGAVGQMYEKQESTIRELRKDIVDLKEFKQKQEGKGQGGKDVLYIITIIILIVGFILTNFYLKK